jgi:hypothetical protein
MRGIQRRVADRAGSASAPLPAALVRRGDGTPTVRRSLTSISTAGDGLVGMFLPIWLGGRFNASSTIPMHVAGPWVIVETPTRHHPRRRGRPIPRRLLHGWSERVRIRQRLRAHICAGSGRSPGATPKMQHRRHAMDSTRFYGNPRFFVRQCRFRGGPGLAPGGRLLTRDEARRIAANITTLTELLGQASSANDNGSDRCSTGAQPIGSTEGT